MEERAHSLTPLVFVFFTLPSKMMEHLFSFFPAPEFSECVFFKVWRKKLEFLCPGWFPLWVFVSTDLLFVTPLVPWTEHNMFRLEMCYFVACW